MELKGFVYFMIAKGKITRISNEVVKFWDPKGQIYYGF